MATPGNGPPTSIQDLGAQAVKGIERSLVGEVVGEAGISFVQVEPWRDPVALRVCLLHVEEILKSLDVFRLSCMA